MEMLEGQAQQGIEMLRVEAQAKLCSEVFMFIWTLHLWSSLTSQKHWLKGAIR